jgi:hypothetical protein
MHSKAKEKLTSISATLDLNEMEGELVRAPADKETDERLGQDAGRGEVARGLAGKEADERLGQDVGSGNQRGPEHARQAPPSRSFPPPSRGCDAERL